VLHQGEVLLFFLPFQDFHSFGIVFLIEIFNVYLSDLALIFIKGIESNFVAAFYLAGFKNLFHVEDIVVSFEIETIVRVHSLFVF
jgi:hypothetical protein